MFIHVRCLVVYGLFLTIFYQNFVKILPVIRTKNATRRQDEHHSIELTLCSNLYFDHCHMFDCV